MTGKGSHEFLTVPITVQQDFGNALGSSIQSVVDAVRNVALRDISLRSSMLPRSIFLQNIAPDLACYAPMVVAVDRGNCEAWITVTISDAHWAQLAYQFGHELGHVVCNSWGGSGIPYVPSEWIEEALVEAFSVRSLMLLAQCWAAAPPDTHWCQGYHPHLTRYAASVIDKYEKLAARAPFALLSKDHLATMAVRTGLHEESKMLVPAIVREFLRDKSLLEDMSALNAWPERSALDPRDFVDRWVDSCNNLGCPGKLPLLLKSAWPDLLD